ncbi:2,3-diaminopropionate biosynthesis protein SbnA [Micromonospora sp. C28ISP2-4]|uniref:2,3-diaminopropionate biosynthesis protein SbnA n=1 Tax=Micromonospora sp. C28ISP2-4 TaxID=3059523 RepID=UPI002674A1B0|nr:2,3-diaminopropionate biosynthesis protein SbnA [Micromonospora sp. C28ISP2-4]MDO3686674.1 2,3-diaminopropionate biosynthesis protein SbnA [Micromonospora sp. C28ISP2-4]
MSHEALLGRLAMVGRAMPRTPLVQLRHDRLNLFAKLEYVNLNGSSKDRSAYWILRRAVERGDVTEQTTIVESSSGNFAISLASFCRWLGLSFVPVIDPNVNAATEAYLRRLCDRVEKVTEHDTTGGYLSTRLRRVEELRAELPGAYWPNQYANLDAVDAHDQLTGAELCRDLPRLDYLFVGVSTGGTIAGLSTRLKRFRPDTWVVAVDAEGSVIFGSPPAKRRLPGLGSSIVPPLVGRAHIDDVVIVPELDAVQGCHELFERHGLYAGGSTGSVYSAIERYFADHSGARPTVAFLCADRGTGYADTVYDPDWVARFAARHDRGQTVALV